MNAMISARPLSPRRICSAGPRPSACHPLADRALGVAEALAGSGPCGRAARAARRGPSGGPRRASWWWSSRPGAPSGNIRRRAAAPTCRRRRRAWRAAPSSSAICRSSAGATFCCGDRARARGPIAGNSAGAPLDGFRPARRLRGRPSTLELQLRDRLVDQEGGRDRRPAPRRLRRGRARRRAARDRLSRRAR